MRTSSSFVRRLATVAMSVAILPAPAALTAGSAAATSPPPAVGVSVDDGTLIHLMNGRVVMRFAISLTRPLTKDEDPVSVRFTTADGTAPANSYHPTTKELLLDASGAMVDVPVNVRHTSETPRWCDPAFDPYQDAAMAAFGPEEFLLHLDHYMAQCPADEYPPGTYFRARLERIEGAVARDVDAVGVITPGGDQITVAAGDGELISKTDKTGKQVSEIRFPVSISRPVRQGERAVLLNAVTVDGSAKAGLDYHATNVRLEIGPQDPTTAHVTVPLAASTDSSHWADRWFVLRIDSAHADQLVDGYGIGTITPPLSVTVRQTAYAVDDSGMGALTFTVSHTYPPADQLRIRYMAEQDFDRPLSGTLTFEPGEHEQSVTVPVHRGQREVALHWMVDNAGRLPLGDLSGTAIGTAS